MEGGGFSTAFLIQRDWDIRPKNCGLAPFQQIHPMIRGACQGAAEKARHSGIGTNAGIRLRHKNGTGLVLESLPRHRDAKGEPEKLVIVNRNITERKRAEEALPALGSGFSFSVGRRTVWNLSRKHHRQIFAGQPSRAENAGLRTGARALGKRSGGDIFRLTANTSIWPTSSCARKSQRHRDGVEEKRRHVDYRAGSGRRINDESGAPAYLLYLRGCNRKTSA